jgi:outer membrane receptor protein involved in Fe transport
MTIRHRSAHSCWMLFAALLFAAPQTGSGQTSTGTIRGYVKDQNGSPISDAQVQARNVENGVIRAASTNPSGAYVLPGLVPSTYELTVRHIGSNPQTRRVVVPIGATLLMDFTMQAGAVELATVTVAAAVETRTSEVATNVTQQQIEQLPTPSRNFLDLAALAPGVSVTEDRANFTSRTFSAGGQSPNSTNIFVDGTSLKNDLTSGGVSGQDASRGNPFPRNAIQEYRVISQNFKAEYQKASSAIVTATTRSGGNKWTGNALFGYQNRDLVALDTFQRATPSFSKPDYTRSLVGLSGGGPIMRDRLFFFGSYEGNYQNRSSLVNFAPPSGFTALDTVNLAQYNGNFTSPFRETLLFGKLSYAVNPTSSAELSFSNRHETDIRDFGTNNCPGAMCAFQEAVNFRQDISVAQLRYNRFSGAWLNEAKVDYSRFRRNPSPNSPGLPARIFQYSGADHVIGSNFSTQDFIQTRVGFRDDLTYSGLQAGGDHVIKVGASVDLVTYDVFKGNDETPRFYYRDTLVRAGDTLAFNYRTPYQLIYGTGNASLNKTNNQLGIYAQDDWSPTTRLTINAGIRWDFESKMMNYDYQTPQMVIDTLTRYNDSLPTPLDLSRYISTGNSRKPFYGAFQPRLGFSYALDDDNRTTVFGGWGIYYDRSLFDISVDETLKLTHPTYTVQFAHPDSTPGAGEAQWDDSLLNASKATLDAFAGTTGAPEAWLIDKDAKVPMSRQWNFGIRHVMGDYTLTATVSAVRGINQLTLNWANFGLNPNGSCCTSFNIGAHGFSNFIYSTNDGRTWYDALQVQIDRRYRRSSENFGWGGGLALTWATRSVEGVDGLGDLFAFPNALNIPKHPANDERIRVVANWITDVPFGYGAQFSGLITLGTGNRLDVGCPLRFCGTGYERGGFTPQKEGFIIPNAFAYRRVDLRLRKDFPNISGTTLGVTLDLFNAFNHQNLGCFNTGSRTDLNFGKAGCVVSDPRRLQIGAEYSF